MCCECLPPSRSSASGASHAREVWSFHGESCMAADAVAGAFALELGHYMLLTMLVIDTSAEGDLAGLKWLAVGEMETQGSSWAGEVVEGVADRSEDSVPVGSRPGNAANQGTIRSVLRVRARARKIHGFSQRFLTFLFLAPPSAMPIATAPKLVRLLGRSCTANSRPSTVIRLPTTSSGTSSGRTLLLK